MGLKFSHRSPIARVVKILKRYIIILSPRCSGTMSLFRHGFKTIEGTEQSGNNSNTNSLPDAEFSEAATYLPNQENTFLGSVEFQAVVSAIEDKANPDTENSSEAKKRGNYNHYSPEIRAKIGKYASENGNSKEIKHFKAEFPNLKEGTVRTFKQA